MFSKQIQNLEEIFEFRKKPKILEYTVTPLTASGENYGSTVLKVDIIVETAGSKETIHTVAKLLPNNQLDGELFNAHISIRNEILFYKNVVPLVQNLNPNHDIFPEYYGSRLDPDQILLLENLKMENYSNVDRFEGLDFDCAKVVIENLALFHAAPLNLKLENKDIFEKEIRNVCLSPWRMDIDYHYKARRRLEKNLSTIPELRDLEERILIGFDRKLVPDKPREPLATVVHNDYWINNIMIKFENGKPVKSKIVDMQSCVYGSPAKDLLFFLFDSVKTEVLEKHFNELVLLYHKTFLSFLGHHGKSKEFSWNSFQKELDFEAVNTQFGHIVYMLFVIFAPKESVFDYTLSGLLKMEPTTYYREKLIFIAEEFAKRDWI